MNNTPLRPFSHDINNRPPTEGEQIRDARLPVLDAAVWLLAAAVEATKDSSELIDVSGAFMGRAAVGADRPAAAVPPNTTETPGPTLDIMDKSDQAKNQAMTAQEISDAFSQANWQ